MMPRRFSGVTGRSKRFQEGFYICFRRIKALSESFQNVFFFFYNFDFILYIFFGLERLYRPRKPKKIK